MLVYAILVGRLGALLRPFLWTISTSLKTLPETTGFDLLPNHPSLSAYREVLTEFDFLRYAANSFFLAGTITLANLILCSLGGYAFARLRFPGREVLFILVLATLMIPDQLRLVPVFVMLSGWGLVGSFSGYMLIKLVLATNLFFMRQYFLTIPKDFEEAAKLDNAGHFKTFWKVMLPLTGPALAAITILDVPGDLERVLLAADPAGLRRSGPLHRPVGDRAVQLPVRDAVAAADGGERDCDPADRRPLRHLPAVLRRRGRRERGQRMTVSSGPAPARCATCTSSRGGS